ncbi:MAG TPA: YraN family protein [Vicinamibacteria bacterium]|nr:YraN family protein [Vicinamibacteria bacterium]
MATKIADFLSWVRDRGRTSDLGRRGENVAARELERLGYEIVERRWRSKLGEIDIVARDGETLVVVEVKARSREDYGPPADAVDAVKRRKLVRLAKAYLQARRLGEPQVRFDVVGVRFPSGEDPRVEVLRNAFGE